MPKTGLAKRGETGFCLMPSTVAPGFPKIADKTRYRCSER
jgi:hypothetical protein